MIIGDAITTGATTEQIASAGAMGTRAGRASRCQDRALSKSESEYFSRWLAGIPSLDAKADLREFYCAAYVNAARGHACQWDWKL